jgi:hypothetical protein
VLRNCLEPGILVVLCKGPICFRLLGPSSACAYIESTLNNPNWLLLGLMPELLRKRFLACYFTLQRFHPCPPERD